ncbi:MAG: lytic murein transglycosylase [Methylococcales bacterium]|nr:lytic murein transglycosylase [Methylococcales bacterium]
MTSLTLSAIPIFTLALLLTACNPEPIIYHQDHYKGLSQPIIPSQPSTTKPKTAPKQIGHYSASKLTGAYASSTGTRNFIRYMAKEHGFKQNYLNGLFSQARHLQSVVKLETPSSKIKTSFVPSPGSWSRYRKKFLTTTHINNGVKFWKKNALTIQKASATYHVNPEYIVAIIGVETFFGLNVGKTRTLDALSTLAFHTKRRSKFFTSELENFLLMTTEENLEPRKVVGSWAGAMGLGQFMPSSFRRLAVDFNEDGKRDLWNPTDAIGSVAHYFSKSGWQFNKPVVTKTQQKTSASTIKLSAYSGNEFWRTHPNFKVIKKYNHSNHYAMAVHQLSQAIKQRYQQ